MVDCENTYKPNWICQRKEIIIAEKDPKTKNIIIAITNP